MLPPSFTLYGWHYNHFPPPLTHQKLFNDLRVDFFSSVTHHWHCLLNPIFFDGNRGLNGVSIHLPFAFLDHKNFPFASSSPPLHPLFYSDILFIKIILTQNLTWCNCIEVNTCLIFGYSHIVLLWDAPQYSLSTRNALYKTKSWYTNLCYRL